MKKALQQDRFKEYYDRAVQNERNLQGFLAERQQKLRMKQATGGTETMLRHEIDKAQSNLKEIEQLAYKYERHPEEHNDVPAKEKEKRVLQVKDFKAKIGETLKASQKACGIVENAVLIDIEAQPLIEETVEGKNNKQVLMMHRDMLNKQDDKLDEVISVVKIIKHENEDFGTELALQNRMLGGLNQRVDATTAKLTRIDERLKQMIAKQSKSFYYVVILVEILAIVLLIIL